MTKLQTVHWLLLIVPLIIRWALRIWQKNLRPLINKKPTRFPPVPPSEKLSDPARRWT